MTGPISGKRNPLSTRFLGAVVLIFASLLLVAGCGGDDTSPTGLSEVEEMFEGLEASGSTVGNPDAPVEVIEYMDLQCPHCKTASEDIVPTLLEDYVRTGDVRLTARPLQVVGPASLLGARGAAAAAEQDATWLFVETIFNSQGPTESGWLTETLMRNVATDLGLDVEAWDEALVGSSEQTVADDVAAAEKDEVPGVPFFVVEGPGGREKVFQASLSNVEDAIKKVSPANS